MRNDNEAYNGNVDRHVKGLNREMYHMRNDIQYLRRQNQMLSYWKREARKNNYRQQESGWGNSQSEFGRRDGRSEYSQRDDQSYMSSGQKPRLPEHDAYYHKPQYLHDEATLYGS